jgi:hypothetical protein
MGNPMTPFVPPIIVPFPAIVSIACATNSITNTTVTLPNNVTRVIKLTASNGALAIGAVTTFTLPTTAPPDIYTFIGAYSGVTGNAYVYSSSTSAYPMVAPNITMTFWWSGTSFFHAGPTSGVAYA